MIVFDDIKSVWYYEPTAVNIKTLLASAVKRLRPDRRSPVAYLFAVDGLGRKPRIGNIRGDKDS